MDTSLIERMKRACLNNRYRQNYGTMEACMIDVIEVYGDSEPITCPTQTCPDPMEQPDCESDLEYLEDTNLAIMIILAVFVTLCAYQNRGNIWDELVAVVTSIAQITLIRIFRGDNADEIGLDELSLDSLGPFVTENIRDVTLTNETIRPTQTPPPPPPNAKEIIDEPPVCAEPPQSVEVTSVPNTPRKDETEDVDPKGNSNKLIFLIQ